MVDDRQVDPFSRPPEPTTKKPGSIRVNMTWLAWLSAAQAARAKKPPEEPPSQPNEPPGLELFWQIYDALLPQKAWSVGVSVLSGQEERFYPVDISPREQTNRRLKRIAGYRRTRVRLVHGWPVGGQWKPFRPDDVMKPKSVSRLVNKATAQASSIYQHILSLQRRADRAEDTRSKQLLTELAKRCPGIEWFLRHETARQHAIINRLLEVLRRFASTRTSVRAAFQSPETLAIALTAAALRKSAKSIERQVDLEDAPWSVSLRDNPRPPGYKVTRTTYQKTVRPARPK